MARPPAKPSHPGAFVREQVLPSGMTVTEAARRLEVGRPALSNMLNGKAALSPEMAARLEKAFGADKRGLLDRQTAFERGARADADKAIAVAKHVPEFLAIEARQIAAWADRAEARRLLPVLLRKLVHATAEGLERADFPGREDAERKGWDGETAAEAATPWVPRGRSCWEFGVGKDPRRKAEDDYNARLASVPAEERAECAFVFATPRRWPGKTAWTEEKRRAGEWADVRAFDAGDLEQWLEQSPPTQVWFAERLGFPVEGCRSLERCAAAWAGACDPPLAPALFDGAVEAHSEAFGKWLAAPPGRPFVVAADSRGEALAFLSCLLDTAEAGARAIVFDTEEAARRMEGLGLLPPVVVAGNPEVERALAGVSRERRLVAVRPGNDPRAKPDIRLERLDRAAFEAALLAMDLSEDRIERLARESARSPTILRRRLSGIPAVRDPAWARDKATARGLLPAALAGAWDEASTGDREVLRLLAGAEDYGAVERGVAALCALEDPPVWAAGSCRGVASRIDALFGVAEFVTRSDLENFFTVAELVLSERDPALDLPEDQRFAASVYGKARDHSDALRAGLRETPILLAVFGEDLFGRRLGCDPAVRVEGFVGKLLENLDGEAVLSRAGDLPAYAEAAPGTFLSRIEEDLRRDAPAVLELMRPARGGIFGRAGGTELLSALQCLAWKHLGRVSAILARLSRSAAENNWENTPIASLENIYRWWMPRTAAPVNERARTLRGLAKCFPDIGWRVCIAQWNSGPQLATPSYRPRWRDDAVDAGRATRMQEDFIRFRREALDLALAWPRHDERTLGDLVARLGGLSDEDHGKVWDLIEGWTAGTTDDRARAELRRRIRLEVLSRHGGAWKLDEATKKRARAAIERLTPDDPVLRHAWLFSTPGNGPFDGEPEDEKPDCNKVHENIRRQRVEAMKEIWEARGFDGVAELLPHSRAPWHIGGALEPNIADMRTRMEFVRRCFAAADPPSEWFDECVRSFLGSAGLEGQRALIEAVAAESNDADWIARLHRCAPFRRETWRSLDRHGDEVRDLYWREVAPVYERHDDGELAELIERLLAARRPFAAFAAARYDRERVETSRLKRILLDMIAVEDATGSFYRPESFEIFAALEELGRRNDTAGEELAILEFRYIPVLGYGGYEFRNLDRAVAASPALFVRILALAFERDDGGQDPPEWRIEGSENRKAFADAAYQYLGYVGRVRGAGNSDELDAEALSRWIDDTRRLCDEYGRAEDGGHYIGQLLARTPAGEDGVHPCPPLREAMERVGSSEIGRGFHIGVYNARGLRARVGKGGAQERELAARYRDWAARCAPEHPFVASVLEDIAAGYDGDARRQDDEAEIDSRLHL